jgi:glutathione synthase/RimK-type ligase-like ATP-grasp enzyme
LIVKLLEGTQGKGLVLGQKQQRVLSTKSLNANILVQEFIKANGKTFVVLL